MSFISIAGYFLLLGFGQTNGNCRSFKDNIPKKWEQCSSWCTGYGEVWGTEFYHPDSSICTAAQHAGILLPSKGGQVNYGRRMETQSFIGTISNRVVSYSKNGSNTGLYYFTSEKNSYGGIYTPDSWLPDVYLLHDSYLHGEIRIACVFDSIDDDVNNDPRLYSFKEEILGNANADGDRSTYIIKSRANVRASVCHGRHPITDVAGIFSPDTDNCKTDSQNTFSVNKGEDLNISIDCDKDRLARFIRRFPDGWIQHSQDSGVDSSLSFPSISKENSGYYVVGTPENRYANFNDTVKYVEGYGAHFKIIVRDCTSGRYGVDCDQDCRPCHNGGICHPLTGSCMCKPGFNGASCQNACPPDQFGSQCHLTCTKNETNLLFGVYTARSYFVDRHQEDCRGITFCLPEPLGCSCLNGYEGRRCIKKMHHEDIDVETSPTFEWSYVVYGVGAFLLVLILIFLIN